MSEERSFVPKELWGDKLDITHFENPYKSDDFVYAPCPCCETCPDCGYHGAPTDGIIVAVDGACPDNGRSNARAGYGVYFNAKSSFNTAGLLEKAPFTNQRAEIFAACVAITKCKGMLDDHGIKWIVIKSDSAYLVNNIVTNVQKWRVNGYKTARGTPVVNGDLFQQLDGLVTSLANRGVFVRFWHVLRDQNKQADKLANAAVGGIDWEKFTEGDFTDMD